MPGVEEIKSSIEERFKSGSTWAFPMSLRDFEQVSEFVAALTKSTKAHIVSFDNKATVVFDNCPNLTFNVSNTSFLEKHHFKFLTVLTVFQSASKQKISFISFIWSEIRLHWIVCILGTFIFAPVFVVQDSDAFIQNVNTALIMTATIVVTVFLIFISFFYSTKSGDENYFLGGTYYRHSKDDRFVTALAFACVVLSVVAMGVQFYTVQSTDPVAQNMHGLTYLLAIPHFLVSLPKWIGNSAPGLFTWISVLSLYLCIRAITDYYFDRIQNEFYKQVMRKVISRYSNKSNVK